MPGTSRDRSNILPIVPCINFPRGNEMNQRPSTSQAVRPLSRLPVNPFASGLESVNIFRYLIESGFNSVPYTLEPDMNYIDDYDEELILLKAIVKTRLNAEGEINVKDKRNWVHLKPRAFPLPPTPMKRKRNNKKYCRVSKRKISEEKFRIMLDIDKQYIGFQRRGSRFEEFIKSIGYYFPSQDRVQIYLHKRISEVMRHLNEFAEIPEALSYNDEYGLVLSNGIIESVDVSRAGDKLAIVLFDNSPPESRRMGIFALPPRTLGAVLRICDPMPLPVPVTLNPGCYYLFVKLESKRVEEWNSFLSLEPEVKNYDIYPYERNSYLYEDLGKLYF
ncbi:hypothetical protein NPIL_493671 [Nephila pilipes]|uniref:Uncharacterized protein n=1 Tax=Nephila pilipes TaxID=299642 RepID=A0A8X6Q768_NEPPI|nr:hypothetical protein NPIL_493671 [Nephila pilipes]